ncbi:MAG: hypothetical protein ACE5JX_09990 [Acidobacteriota bacterium]
MKWKKFLFSGLGGLAVAAVAWVARRGQRRRSIGEPLPIPDDVGVITIETEEIEQTYRRRTYLSKVVYTCHPTKFRVWSFLRKPGGGETQAPSERIYHISPVTYFRSRSRDDRTSLAAEEFYATLHLPLNGGRESLSGHIAQGANLEFHKCHVGGSMNGVKTGDQVVAAPIRAFQFS